MNPYILILMFCVVTTVTYFLTLGLFNLMREIVERFGKSLKAIFVFCGLLGSIWIFQNPQKANKKFEQLKNWDGDIHAIVTPKADEMQETNRRSRLFKRHE